jgi:hypothetical protein
MAKHRTTLTPHEPERLASLVAITTHSQALDILAVERGEHPDLWLNGKPEPWPPERELRPYETPLERYLKAEFTRWIIADDLAADLVADYGAMVEVHGKTGLYSAKGGRAVVVAMVERLYAFEEPVSQGAFD